MGERTVLAAFIDFQKPNYCRKQYNWRFYKEVSLLLHPTFIQVQHDGITGFIRIRSGASGLQRWLFLGLSKLIT